MSVAMNLNFPQVYETSGSTLELYDFGSGVFAFGFGGNPAVANG
jgi:hypothetical protein